jgi:DNA-directed RNA polymerase specialized sigma24 family protein
MESKHSWDRILQGLIDDDPEAFRALAVQVYALRSCQVAPSVRSDVQSCVLLRLLVRLRRPAAREWLNGIRDLETYVRQLLRREAVQWLRDECHSTSELPIHNVAAPTEHAQRASSHEVSCVALSRLPAHYHLSLFLHHSFGLSVAQTGRVLEDLLHGDWGRERTNATLKRARQALRRIMMPLRGGVTVIDK